MEDPERRSGMEKNCDASFGTGILHVCVKFHSKMRKKPRPTNPLPGIFKVFKDTAVMVPTPAGKSVRTAPPHAPKPPNRGQETPPQATNSFCREGDKPRNSHGRNSDKHITWKWKNTVDNLACLEESSLY